MRNRYRLQTLSISGLVCTICLMKTLEIRRSLDAVFLRLSTAAYFTERERVRMRHIVQAEADIDKVCDQ